MPMFFLFKLLQTATNVITPVCITSVIATVNTRGSLEINPMHPNETQPPRNENTLICQWDDNLYRCHILIVSAGCTLRNASGLSLLPESRCTKSVEGIVMILKFK